MDFLKRLTQPYPSPLSGPHHHSTPIIFGICVFIFVYLTTPGSLDFIGKIFYSLSFAGVTVGMIYLLRVLGKILAEKILDEEKWTLIKEIAWVSFNFLCIAIANTFLGVILKVNSFSWAAVLNFIGITTAVGLPPLVIVILLRQNRLLKANLEQANAMTRDIQRTGGPTDQEDKKTFLYAESQKNYVVLYFLQGTEIKEEQQRKTMTALTQEFEDQSHHFRCHRAFLVNLTMIESVDGNAQGYRLRLNGVRDEIPVSRSYLKAFRAKMDVQNRPATRP